MKGKTDKEKRKGGRSKMHEKHFILSEKEVTTNISVILEEMEWLEYIVDHRVKELEEGIPPLVFSQCPPPPIKEAKGPYAELIQKHDLKPVERLLLISCLIPHFAPELFTKKFRDDQHHLKVKYPEIGGYIDRTFMNYVPTLQTILFLLAETDKTNATFYNLALSRKGALFIEQIILLDPLSVAVDDTNMLTYVPALAQEYVSYLQSGRKPRPDFGKSFPATLVKTNLEWEDLILSSKTRGEIEKIMNWVDFKDELLKLSDDRMNPSFPCLFWGPPGTGKSLSAKLIGKYFKKDIFRIDLSMVVSKYIGETEKNLAYLFDRAENKDWILFFDEADALFGKRTDISDSHDKWANLEVSYLLQRMEEYTGLTILATNYKDNLDPALTRRFQAIIQFPKPEYEERIRLWETAIPKAFSYDERISVEKLAKFDLTGAHIANIIKQSCLAALAGGSKILAKDHLVKAIRNELDKEGRTP